MVRVRLIVGLLDCWIVGLKDYWIEGLLDCWSSELVECWKGREGAFKRIPLNDVILEETSLTLEIHPNWIRAEC